MISTLLVGGLAAVVIAALVAWSAVDRYARWFGEQAFEGIPYVQVRYLGSVANGREPIEVVLRGTKRPFRLLSIRGSRAESSALGLKCPDGFRVTIDPELGSETVVWEPSNELVLIPGQPFMLDLSRNPDSNLRTVLHLSVETKIGLGGQAAGAQLHVGPLPPTHREALNLRAELTAQARELGVAGHAVPGWDRLIALEADLGTSEAPRNPVVDDDA